MGENSATLILYAGVFLAVVAMATAIIPLWLVVPQHIREKKDPKVLLFPTFVTIIGVVSMTMLGVGSARVVEGYALHNEAASKPKDAFVEAVKERNAALVPQTDPSLLAERDALRRALEVAQKEVTALKAKQEADNYKQFRDQLVENPPEKKENVQ